MPFINNYQMALNYLGFIKYKASAHTTHCESWSFRLNYWNDCFRVCWTFAIFRPTLNQLNCAERGRKRESEKVTHGTHVRSINGFSCSNPMDTLYFTITLNFHIIARWGLNILSACRSEKYAENVKDLQAKTTNCSSDFTTNRTNRVPGSAFTLRHPFVSTVWRFFSLFAINR